MDNRRALVVVTRAYGDPGVSEAIIRGTVGREMRMIQAERDLLRKRQNRENREKIVQMREKYAIKPVGKFRRRIEQVIGLVVMLIEWRKEQRAGV